MRFVINRAICELKKRKMKKFKLNWRWKKKKRRKEQKSMINVAFVAVQTSFAHAVEIHSVIRIKYEVEKKNNFILFQMIATRNTPSTENARCRVLLLFFF